MVTSYPVAHFSFVCYTPPMEHTLARELNAALAHTAAGALMSDLGRRIFFPKGIIAQSAEAKQQGKRGSPSCCRPCRG
jgi:hypothetical protein